MTVKDAIRYLQRDYKPDDEIIVAWWDKNFFEDMTEEKWNETVEVVDHRMDWSSTHEDIIFVMEEYCTKGESDD